MQDMILDPSPLVGLAVGDALGMPFETWVSTDPRLLAWDGKTFHASEYHKLKPGQWTDDTIMSTALAESLVAYRGFYPVDVADRYLAWFKSGDFRGMGETTKQALTNLSKGTPWTRSGIPGAEGNGSAMRAGPLGFFYREDPLTVVEFVRQDARMTHASFEAEMGSVAVALGVALLSTGQAQPQTLALQVAECLEDSIIKDRLRQVGRVPPEVYTAARAVAMFGTKAHVLETVPSAFAAFALTNSYEEAVQVAIRAGGDTDTTAAITGSLAGSFYGYEAIPKAWREGLEDSALLHSLELELRTEPRWG